jgi:hypothetical protein
MTALYDLDEARAAVAALRMKDGGSRAGLTVYMPCGGCSDPISAQPFRRGNVSGAADWLGVVVSGDLAAWHRECARKKFVCAECEEAPATNGIRLVWTFSNTNDVYDTVVCWQCKSTVENLVRKKDGELIGNGLLLWEAASPAEQFGLVLNAARR